MQSTRGFAATAWLLLLLLFTGCGARSDPKLDDGTTGPAPGSETDCANGADDDHDGLADCTDPDCVRNGVCTVATCAAGACCYGAKSPARWPASRTGTGWWSPNLRTWTP